MGTLSVTIGQALSRRHGVSPLTLELSDWGRPRGGSFLPSLGCRFLMSSLLVGAPGQIELKAETLGCSLPPGQNGACFSCLNRAQL